MPSKRDALVDASGNPPYTKQPRNENTIIEGS